MDKPLSMNVKMAIPNIQKNRLKEEIIKEILTTLFYSSGSRHRAAFRQELKNSQEKFARAYIYSDWKKTINKEKDKIFNSLVEYFKKRLEEELKDYAKRLYYVEEKIKVLERLNSNTSLATKNNTIGGVSNQ